MLIETYNNMVCVFVFVCLRAYVYVCMCAFVFVCMCLFVCSCSGVCVFVYVCACESACVWACVASSFKNLLKVVVVVLIVTGCALKLEMVGHDPRDASKIAGGWREVFWGHNDLPQFPQSAIYNSPISIPPPQPPPIHPTTTTVCDIVLFNHLPLFHAR